jgi:ectoine hydroxylase-related dioxygenase (phytanoyl-CoA dioxygenase family)
MSTATQTLAQQYARDGYVVHPESALGPELLDRARQGMLDVAAGEYRTGIPPEARNGPPGGESDRLVKIELPQRSSSDLLDAIRASRLGELAAEVTGASWVQAWWVQGLVKPPTPGRSAATNVGWHQDFGYWSKDWEDGSELFTAWLALSDVGPESGPMQFVSQSHEWGMLGGDFFNQDLSGQRAGLQLPAGAEWSEVADVLPAGGVSFHHCRLLHGSNQNVSTEPRISMAIHLRTEKSAPLPHGTNLTAYLDDPAVCPVIFGDR